MHIRTLVALSIVLSAAGALCVVPGQAQDVYSQRQTLEQARVALGAERAELSVHYTPKNPLMIAVNAKIKALDKKLKTLDKQLKQLPTPNSQEVIRHSRVWLLSGSARQRD